MTRTRRVPALLSAGVLTAAALGLLACSSGPKNVENKGYNLEALPQGEQNLQKPSGLLKNENLPAERQVE